MATIDKQNLDIQSFQVVAIPEGGSDADGLMAALGSLTSDVVVVLDASLITDVSLKALVCTHYVESAMATIALVKRKSSASKNTKPGKAPKVTPLPLPQM